MRHKNNEDRVRAALEKVWLASRPEALSRLAALEDFLAERRSGKTNEQRHADALSAAHRLSGSLGMFGMSEASSCASEIEMLLSQSVPDITKVTEQVCRLRKLMEGTRNS